MSNGNEKKIKKYHYEEIMLILFICASDLSTYNDEDLVSFSECIEGRVDVLFDPNYLPTIDDYLKIDSDTINNFRELRSLVMRLYSSQWHKKMKQNESEWGKVNALAKNILLRLNITYMEPKNYAETHLDVDWT